MSQDNSNPQVLGKEAQDTYVNALNMASADRAVQWVPPVSQSLIHRDAKKAAHNGCFPLIYYGVYSSDSAGENVAPAMEGMKGVSCIGRIDFGNPDHDLPE